MRRSCGRRSSVRGSVRPWSSAPSAPTRPGCPTTWSSTSSRPQQDLERAVAALAAGDADAAARAAAAAAAVAARGFLPGWSGLWVERRQAELRELRLGALEALAQASCARGAWADAVGAAEEAIGVEPFRESAFQLLIAAHRGAGNPAEALRAYERCRRTLAEELGVSPSAATESAYLAVLTEEPAMPAPVEVPQLALPLALDAGRGSVLVGRKAETDRLRSALERAAVDGRQAVLVGGDPGIGKTALVGDFARQAHAQGARVLYGRCDEEIGIAYQPFAEAFGHFVDRCALAELSAHVGAHGGELARIAPQLMRRLPDTPPPRVTGSDGDRYRFFEAAAALLDQASRDRLVVLVLDDLQWAAPQTLALLRHILRPRRSWLLVVGTYRHTEVGPDDPLASTLADLWREPGVERILLTGLDELGVSAFVEANARHGSGASDEPLARALHARTGGNPFFVGEFLRHLDESGAVFGKEGRWSYYQDDDELGLPQGVRDVVARRLGRLSAGANRVLTLASVVGLDFEIQLLERVDQGGTPDVVLDALDEAVAAHVIAELDPGSVPVRPRPRAGHGVRRADRHAPGPPPPQGRRRACVSPGRPGASPARAGPPLRRGGARRHRHRGRRLRAGGGTAGVLPGGMGRRPCVREAWPRRAGRRSRSTSSAGSTSSSWRSRRCSCWSGSRWPSKRCSRPPRLPWRSVRPSAWLGR